MERKDLDEEFKKIHGALGKLRKDLHKMNEEIKEVKNEKVRNSSYVADLAPKRRRRG